MSIKKKLIAGDVLGLGPALFTVDGAKIANARVTVNTGGEWTLSGNEASINNSTNTNRRLATAASDLILKTNQDYSVSFEVVSIASGAVRVECGAGLGTNRTTPGTFVQTINSGANQNCGVRAFSAGTTCLVRNVTYTEV